MAPFYGPHRDELYFASAGDRLAWGYPDQPSLVALLARRRQRDRPAQPGAAAAPQPAGRRASLVVLAGLIARLLGGDRRAQVLAAVVTATSVVVVAVGHRLTTQTFDIAGLGRPSPWSPVTRCVDDRPRLWLLAGVVAGVGLNAKHDVAVAPARASSSASR